MLNAFFSFIKKYAKKPKITIPVVGALVVGGFLLARGGNTPAQEFITAQRKTVEQSVSVTGRVKPAESVSLAFEKSGKITSAGVSVGNRVSQGQVLVTLASGDLSADLIQAEASVRAEQAKLAELERGSRPEEIQVEEIKVRNAEIALMDAKNNLIDKIQDAYTKSDDAVHNKIDQFFDNPRSVSPTLKFTVDYQLNNNITERRKNAEYLLQSWNQLVFSLSVNSVGTNDVGPAKQNTSEIRSLIELSATAINSLTVSNSLSQTTLDAWKADVLTARTNINTALNNLTAAEEKLRSADSALQLARQQLDLKMSGSDPQQIEAQRAQVERAQANANNIRAQLSKNVIVAPIAGVITKQDAKVGEIASPNINLVSLISDSQYEIEANVPEADIAKVKVGDMAKTTLDAYGNDVEFDARVVSIDPAETIVEGVATYKITLQFANKDEKIKSGMTANVDVGTEKKENVIAIPQRSVVSKDGKKIVRVLKGENTIEEVEVTTGLRGSDGSIEITSGLSEGDKIVLFSEVK